MLLKSKIQLFSLFACLIALSSGCGGGGGAPATVVGQWSRASIGQPGQVASALVPCPNSIALAGSTNLVSCKTGELLFLNADGTFVIDLMKNQTVESSTQLPTRTWGKYTLTEGRIFCAISSRSFDFNGDGIYEPVEGPSSVVGSSLSITVREVTAGSMLAEITQEGVTHTARFTKTNSL